jgi:hypothetical protein
MTLTDRNWRDTPHVRASGAVTATNELRPRLLAVEQALELALTSLDRREPLAEAQFAVLEAALLLIRAGEAPADQLPAERLELLGDALGSVRAAVQATSVTVVRARDALRRPNRTNSPHPPLPNPVSSRSRDAHVP